MNIVEEFGLDPETFIWQDLAMCHNLPIEAFFEDADESDAVASICAYCPVREFCLTHALDNKEEGFWGGHYVKGGKIVD